MKTRKIKFDNVHIPPRIVLKIDSNRFVSFYMPDNNAAVTPRSRARARIVPLEHTLHLIEASASFGTRKRASRMFRLDPIVSELIDKSEGRLERLDTVIFLNNRETDSESPSTYLKNKIIYTDIINLNNDLINIINSGRLIDFNRRLSEYPIVPKEGIIHIGTVIDSIMNDREDILNFIMKTDPVLIRHHKVVLDVMVSKITSDYLRNKYTNMLNNLVSSDRVSGFNSGYHSGKSNTSHVDVEDVPKLEKIHSEAGILIPVGVYNSRPRSPGSSVHKYESGRMEYESGKFEDTAVPEEEERNYRELVHLEGQFSGVDVNDAVHKKPRTSPEPVYVSELGMDLSVAKLDSLKT